MKTLPERLAWARGAAGLSARGLDRKAGLHGGHTQLIESGRRVDPSSETVKRLARALGISIDWLIDGNGMAPSEDALRSMRDSA